MPTPHNAAKKGDFAKLVLMPGDPLRAKFIAENFLIDPVLVTSVRNVYGYTGKTKNGKLVSVMASGMGQPSLGIYANELFAEYGVEAIIRIGTCGTYQKECAVGDIILAQGSCTDSNWMGQYHLPGAFAPIADYHMLETCVDLAKEMGVRYHVGNLLSSDRFYGDDGDLPTPQKAPFAWGKMGVMAAEMESGALYMNAARCGKHALAICTISDHILTHEACSAEERQNSFTQMMELALKTAVKLEK